MLTPTGRMAPPCCDGRLDVSDRGLGLEAYEDDPEYTSPEMEPGHGEDRPAHDPDTHGGHFGAVLAAGLAGGFADEPSGQAEDPLIPEKP